jgi:L-iditol 2-dehydrogenase
LSGATYETILRRQLNIFGTWAWSRLPKLEWETVLAFAARGAIQTRPLISHRYPITRLDEAFAMIGSGQEPYHKVLIVFP